MDRTGTLLPDLGRHLERQMRVQERQLVALRLAAVVVLVVVVLAFRDRLAAPQGLLVLLGGVAAYNLAIALLVGRFPAREVGIVATALDLAAVTIGIYLEPRGLDAYLFYAPVILSAALRFGLAASVWCAVVVSFTYASVVLLAPGSVESVRSLLAVRVGYLLGVGLAAGIFARVVIGRANENARLQHRLEAEARERSRAREAEMLAELAREFGQSLDRTATAGAVVRAAAPLLGDATWLLLVEAERLYLVDVAGPDDALVEAMRGRAAQAPRVGEGIAGGAAATATSILAGSPSTPAPAFPGDPEGVTALGLRSVLAVPVLSRGKVHGVLVSASVSGRPLDENDRRLAEAIAERAGPALENAGLWADLQEQVARERRAQRIKDDFLSIVSHELRTPLTSIQGYAQLLEGRLRGTATSSKELAHLRVIRSQVSRMRRLVEDILDVSRIDRRGGVSVEPSAFDMLDELREAVARATREHPDREIRLEAPDALPVEADHDRIAQVLTNLVDNAMKYSPHGGPVLIGAQTDGRTVTVSVADSGLGIPPEHADHVFERFYQADDDAARRRFGGLGLGLYISRAIIDAHGGEIWVTPNAAAGQGSVFSFRIPVHPAARGRQELVAATGEPSFVLRSRERTP